MLNSEYHLPSIVPEAEMMRRAFWVLLFTCLVGSLSALAQVVAPPSPQSFVVHSNVLSEDRTIWVRMPAAAQGKNDRYPVLYIMDGGPNINEIGSTIDFLAD